MADHSVICRGVKFTCVLLTVVFVFYPEHGTLDSVCLIQSEAWSLASSLIGCVSKWVGEKQEGFAKDEVAPQG